MFSGITACIVDAEGACLECDVSTVHCDKAREELRLMEEALAIVRVSHDAGLYHSNGAKCRMCELFAALDALASTAARPTEQGSATQAKGE